MLKQVHEHITNELQQNARTDTIFVVTAIAFNLIILAVNSGIASSAAGRYAESSDDFIFVIFILMSILINTIAIMALNYGRNNREKLLKGMLAMYKDNDVDKYYDQALLNVYGRRYQLFMGVILCLALTSNIVPLIIRLV